MAKDTSFPAVFAALKNILVPYAPHLTLKTDTADSYYLDAAYSQQYKQDIFFGSVQIKKNYVSFYLMPVYMFPELLEGISEKLTKRRQGKSCFNFTAVDNDLMAELAALTDKGFRRYQQENLIKEK